MVSLISEIHDDLEKGALRLMTEYRARLFVDAVRLCEGKVEAEDLVSRTFSKAIFNLDSYKEDDNLYGWMKTIMVNIHRNDLARPVARGTTPVSSDALEMYAGADNSTDEQILKNSDHDVLRVAIEQLDPEYRKLVSLYYYNELSLKEIASFFQTSTSSVSRKLEIARKIIAAKVGAQLGKKPLAVLLAALLGVGTLFGAWKAAETVWPEIFCPLGEGQSPVVEMNDVGMASVESEVASADEAVMPMNLKSEKQEEVKMNAFARCATAAAMLAASSAVTAVHADNVSSNQALGTAPAVLAAETATGVTRYVNHSGSDETQTGGTSSETAFATVAAAVEASSDGDVILIESSAEPYTVPSNIVISTSITIKGQSGNPEDVVVRRPSTAVNKYRVFTLDNSDAKLQDMTIAGGHTHAVRENGAGVYITAKGGLMDHCVVTGCVVDYLNSAGGIFIASGSPGIVDRCVVTNCTCDAGQDQFGGSALAMEGGTVRNSLLVGNHLTSATAPGGTVHISGGVLENCTVAGNESSHCAGVYVYRNSPVIRNCLIGACSSSNDSAPDSVWSGTAGCFQNCVAEARINDSCGVEQNAFVDSSSGNWHPAVAAVDGVAVSEVWMSDALDLAGNSRIRGEKCDIGCYESDPDVFMASLSADTVSGLEPLRVRFTVGVRNPPGTISCQYDWNGDGVYEESVSSLTVEHQFLAGTYQVKAKVTAGQKEYVVPGRIEIAVSPKTIPVAVGESLSAAIENALDGVEIVLAKGTHDVNAELFVKKNVVIRGATGNPADVTVRRPQNASANYRIFTLDNANAQLKDLTIEGGLTHVLRENGGGVCITAKGGRMDHCVVSGCTADYFNSAGGIFIASGSPGIVDRCVVTNCTCVIGQDQFGGSALAMEGGTVRNSLLVDNHLTTSAAAPGGTVHMSGGVLESCTIAGNDSAHCAGVYVYKNSSVIRNCLIGACSSSSDSAPDSVWSGTASCFQNCVAEAYINDSCVEEKNVFVNASSGNW